MRDCSQQAKAWTPYPNIGDSFLPYPQVKRPERNVRPFHTTTTSHSLRVLLFTYFEHPYGLRGEPVGHSVALAWIIKETSLADDELSRCAIGDT